jgi:lipopolysaccharide exporter
MNYCTYSIMNVTNKFRLTTMTVWGRLILLVPTLILAGSWGGAPAIAAAQAGLGFVALFADLFLLRRAVRITGTDIVGCFYRPVTAAIAMVLVLQLLDQMTSLSLFAAMLTKTVCGAITYIGTLTLVWVLSGRPDGIEALGLEIAAKIMDRRRIA